MPSDNLRRSRDRKKRGTYQTPKETMNDFIANLARAPWLLRQLTKLTAYVSTVLTPILSGASIVVDGQSVDLFSSNQEAAIIAGVVALLSGGLEMLLSYAAAKVSKQNAK